jgi:hypothetical protein
MIVAQHDVFDRLVRHLPDARQHVLGHLRCRLCIHDQDALVADHHARVGVAFGGIAVEAGAEFFE